MTSASTPADTVHRLSSGAVILRMTNEGWLLLLLRAYRHWDFPKGIVEPGEQPKDAALREIREETTISDMAFPWGDEFFESGPYRRGKVSRYYIGVTERSLIELPVNAELGHPEHDEYRWVNVERASDLVSPRVKLVVEWATGILERPADSATP